MRVHLEDKKGKEHSVAHVPGDKNKEQLLDYREIFLCVSEEKYAHEEQEIFNEVDADQVVEGVVRVILVVLQALWICN